MKLLQPGVEQKTAICPIIFRGNQSVKQFYSFYIFCSNNIYDFFKVEKYNRDDDVNSWAF